MENNMHPINAIKINNKSRDKNLTHRRGNDSPNVIRMKFSFFSIKV